MISTPKPHFLSPSCRVAHVLATGSHDPLRRRVSPLEAFAGRDDIADPLYGNAGGAGEEAALRETVRHLRLACAGLLNYLVELDNRCAGLCALRAAFVNRL